MFLRGGRLGVLLLALACIPSSALAQAFPPSGPAGPLIPAATTTGDLLTDLVGTQWGILSLPGGNSYLRCLRQAGGFSLILEWRDDCPAVNTPNVWTGVQAFGDGIEADGATVVFPWRPAIDPACSIGLAGTTCTTSDITLPQPNMRCTANPIGTGLLGGVALLSTAVAYPTTTSFNLSINAVGAIAAGGTVTFSVTCL